MNDEKKYAVRFTNYKSCDDNKWRTETNGMNFKKWIISHSNWVINTFDKWIFARISSRSFWYVFFNEILNYASALNYALRANCDALEPHLRAKFPISMIVIRICSCANFWYATENSHVESHRKMSIQWNVIFSYVMWRYRNDALTHINYIWKSISLDLSAEWRNLRMSSFEMPSFGKLSVHIHVKLYNHINDAKN